jgi:hypothetical protein
VLLIKCQSHTFIRDRIQCKCLNSTNHEIPKTIKSVEFLMVYEVLLHMESDEVGTSFKHPQIINGNVKNLSKRTKMKEKKCHLQKMLDKINVDF